MAVIALTQTEKDTLKADAAFKKYLTDSIMGAAGGVGYLLRLTTFVSVAQAIAYIVARQVRADISVVSGDSKLVDYFFIQMNVRDIDKKDDAGGGDLISQTIAYLNGASRIDILVGDYFAEKGKHW